MKCICKNTDYEENKEGSHALLAFPKKQEGSLALASLQGDVTP